MDTQRETSADPLLDVLLEGRYRLVGLVARGGMATVYRAVDTRLDRTVAVKVMHRSLAEDPEFVARFTREARSAARLSAPEVVAVFDQGRDEATGLAYLVMEYVAGRNLRDLLRQRGALSPARALSLLEPVLRALAAAHSAGIVHRDIKPENVLLGDDGRIKVADFGLARAVETSRATATTGLLIGTVAYLAPEQVQQGTADTRTDVYAAGIVLWEMLTGGPPYEGDSPLSVAYHHVHDDVPPPSSRVAGIPAALDDLVVRATRRDPDLRPWDGRAFLTEVSALRERLPAPEPGPLPVSAPPVVVQDTLVVPRPGPSVALTVPPRRRRRRWRGITLLLVVLALLATAAVWYVGSGRYTTAPSVLSTPVAQAQSTLEGLGFVVSVQPDQPFDEQVPAGQVLAQRPEPGRRVTRHGLITLTVSKGADRRTVPTVVGSTREVAAAAVTSAGLRVGTVTQAFSTVPVGSVVSSDPPAGQPVRPDTAVALVVSKGPELLAVPDVGGQPLDQATTTLQDAGFVVAQEQVFDDRVPKGTVVSQAPAKGTAPRGSTVTLSVSKGPDLVTVPDVTNHRRGEAQALLAAAGLKSQVIAIPGPGTVRSQDPGRGAQVKRGSTVTLFVF